MVVVLDNALEVSLDEGIYLGSLITHRLLVVGRFQFSQNISVYLKVVVFVNNRNQNTIAVDGEGASMDELDKCFSDFDFVNDNFLLVLVYPIGLFRSCLAD